MTEKLNTIDQTIQKLDTLTLPELNELITKIKDHYKLEETVIAPTTNSPQAKEEESKNVSLILKKVGMQGLQVYRIIGSKLGKSLLEAKKLAETLPINILSNVPKEEAQELKTQLEAQGAEVEIK